MLFFILSLFICSLLLLHGDIESNPGPRNSKNHLPSFCHWNLNSLPAHNFSKVLLLKAYNAIYQYDVICLSKTYLDSWILSDHVSLELEEQKSEQYSKMRLSRQFQACLFNFFFMKRFRRHKNTFKKKSTNKAKLTKHKTTKATIFCTRELLRV